MANFHQTREVITYAQKHISGKTLDLGAGSGKYREIIKQKTSEYIAFDMMPGENVDVVGDALNLPFPERSFNTVVSTQVLEHVERPWLMIKEIHRVLKENGICILTAPFLIPYHPDPHDYFRYTKEGMASLFKNESFEIIECDYYGKIFTVFSEMTRFTLFTYKKRRGGWARRFRRYLSKLAKFLDKFVKTDVVYANVYIIAKKQS